MNEKRGQGDTEADPTAAAEPLGLVESLETIAKQLGPFQPENHAVEPEFESPAPRPIPPRLRNGPFGCRFRRNTVAAIGAGLVCLGFARTQLVEDLSWYFLPLGYLTWIALGIIGLSILKVVMQFIRPGPYAYVRDGMAIVARVLRVDYFIETIKVEGGHTSRFGFAIDIQHPDPQSGKLICSQVRTEVLGDANRAKRFGCPFQGGDYVTAVYLPGQLPKSLRIYGLLGLNPDVPYLHKDGKPWQPGMTWFAACALVVGVMLGIWALTTLLASFQFYWPLAGPNGRQWVYFGSFAVVMGILGTLAMRWLLRKESASTDSIDPHRPGMWLAPVAGFVLAGGLLSTLVILYANAKLDRSAPQYREIEVVELWQTTHELIFREYEIEYIDCRTRDKEKHSARPSDLDLFGISRAGLMDIRKGFLGLPWIKQILPVMPVPTPLDELPGGKQAAKDAEIVEIVDPKTHTPVRVALVPVALTEDGESIQVSKELQKHVLDTMRRSGDLEELRTAIQESIETP